MEMNKVEGQLLEELDKKFKKLLEVGDEDAYQLACDLVLWDAKEDFVRNVFPEVVTKGYYYGNGWDLDFRGRQYYEEILDVLYGGNAFMVFTSDLACLFFKRNYEDCFSEDEINKTILEDPGNWFYILFNKWYCNLSEEEERKIVSSVIMDDVKKGKVNPLDFFNKVFNYDYVYDTVKSYNHIDWVWLAKKVGKLEQMVELVENKKEILGVTNESK
jgi:hypothetical protein